MSEEAPDTAPKSATPTYDALSRRDRALVDSYFRHGMNQSRAYFETVYSGKHDDHNEDSVRALASQRFAELNIQRAIEERLRQHAMSANEALYRLTLEGQNVQMRYLRPNGSIDLERLIEDGYAHLVKGTKFDKDGRLVVEFYDAQAAKRLLLQAHGAFGAKGTQEDPVHHEHAVIVIPDNGRGDRGGDESANA